MYVLRSATVNDGCRGRIMTFSTRQSTSPDGDEGPAARCTVDWWAPHERTGGRRPPVRSNAAVPRIGRRPGSITVASNAALLHRRVAVGTTVRLLRDPHLVEHQHHVREALDVLDLLDGEDGRLAAVEPDVRDVLVQQLRHGLVGRLALVDVAACDPRRQG